MRGPGGSIGSVLEALGTVVVVVDEDNEVVVAIVGAVAMGTPGAAHAATMTNVRVTAAIRRMRAGYPAGSAFRRRGIAGGVQLSYN
jgi:hypothetical protein